MLREPDFTYRDVRIWWPEMVAEWANNPGKLHPLSAFNGCVRYVYSTIALNKDIQDAYQSWLAKQIVG